MTVTQLTNFTGCFLFLDLTFTPFKGVVALARESETNFPPRLDYDDVKRMLEGWEVSAHVRIFLIQFYSR